MKVRVDTNGDGVDLMLLDAPLARDIDPNQTPRDLVLSLEPDEAQRVGVMLIEAGAIAKLRRDLKAARK